MLGECAREFQKGFVTKIARRIDWADSFFDGQLTIRLEIDTCKLASPWI